MIDKELIRKKYLMVVCFRDLAEDRDERGISVCQLVINVSLSK